jgi:hypothetical protein
LPIAASIKLLILKAARAVVPGEGPALFHVEQ